MVGSREACIAASFEARRMARVISSEAFQVSSRIAMKRIISSY